MSLLPPPPFTTAAYEFDLPPTWADPAPRFDYYVGLCVEFGWPRGRETIIEFVAAMSQESQLENTAIGNNPENGTPPTSQGFVTLGVGWCQIDSWTGLHIETSTGHRWSPETLRSNPAESLQWLSRSGDAADLVDHEGAERTWFNQGKWHAWKPHKIDPPPDEMVSFHPLREATAAWDRLPTAVTA